MKRQFPLLVLGKESKIIGQICPFCKERFLFGDSVLLLSRKGIYAHKKCVKGGKN